MSSYFEVWWKMPKRHSDRERWEVYLMTILLAMRPILFIGGVLMLIYAITAFSAYPLVGGIALGLAILLFLMVFYDQVTLIVARIGAYIATIGTNK